MRATSLGRTTVPSALSIAKRSTSTFSSLTSRMRRWKTCPPNSSMRISRRPGASALKNRASPTSSTSRTELVAATVSTSTRSAAWVGIQIAFCRPRRAYSRLRSAACSSRPEVCQRKPCTGKPTPAWSANCGSPVSLSRTSSSRWYDRDKSSDSSGRCPSTGQPRYVVEGMTSGQSLLSITRNRACAL